TTLAALGVISPWSPVMDAGTALATPAAYVRGRSPLELQGALAVQNKQCRNCHSLGGEGGEARPGPGRGGDAAHARSTDPAGAAGRGQHAGLRQEPRSRRGERAGRVSRDPAPSESS